MGLPDLAERRAKARHTVEGELPLRLVVIDDGRELTCQALDLSVRGIGITAQTELDVNSVVEIQLSEQSMRMKVKWKRAMFALQGSPLRWRYGLATEQENRDLLSFFNTVKKITTFSHQENNWKALGEKSDLRLVRLRAMRFDLKEHFHSQIKAKGNEEAFKFQVKNLSRTGALLHNTGDGEAPALNSVIEFHLNDDSRIYLPTHVSCFAKIVRHVKLGTEKDSSGLGIKILHVIPQHTLEWQNLFDKLEKEELNF